MNKLVKVKSQYENEWLLNIGDHTVGRAEIIFLSDTSRTVNGKVTVYTKDCQLETYEYCGSDTKQIMSVVEFMRGAQEFIDSHDIVIPRGYTELDSIVLTSDVTPDNADILMEHLLFDKPFGWSGLSNDDKANYLISQLRIELDKCKQIPMYDLVQKSRMGPTKVCSKLDL